MRNAFAFIGALSVGCTFMLILYGILASMRDRTERRAREREAKEHEATEHIRRFSAAMAVLDMDAYRARKANASSASHVASEALPGRLGSQPEIGILTSHTRGGQAL